MWNVCRKPLTGHVIALAQDHEVDVAVLIECPGAGKSMAKALASAGILRLLWSSDRFAIFSRLGAEHTERMEPTIPNDRATFWRIRLGASTDVLLVGVHGPDRLNAEDGDRTLFFQRLVEEITWLEANRVRHRRTIITGDLNANPFETAITSIFGLHAVPVTAVGSRGTRTVRGREYPFFYNPMWAQFGNGISAPRGSYYWNGSGVSEIFWHLIDQVVVRPDAVEWLPEESLRIVTRAGVASLVTASGKPDRATASDHLPLVFELRAPPEA
jgi:hypothetical protein